MDFEYNICFYEEGQEMFSKIDFENLKCLGFKSNLVGGDTEKLLSHLSVNGADIVVLNLNNIENERALFLIDIIKDNFCDNVLVLTKQYIENDKVYQLITENFNNFDLKLKIKLMDIKRDIEMNPSKNITVLKSKVFDILNQFLFSTRHDGFYYYIDAVIFAYMKHPQDYFTMDLYKMVADKHGKSVSAVEKGMRMALMSAFNRLKNAPKTKEFDKLRAHLTYDLNNNTAICMIKNMLLNDEDIKGALIKQKEFVFRK